MKNLEDDLKSRYRALKTVQEFINELKHLRNNGSPSQDELLDIDKFITGLINSYKGLASDVNKHIK